MRRLKFSHWKNHQRSHSWQRKDAISVKLSSPSFTQETFMEHRVPVIREAKMGRWWAVKNSGGDYPGGWKGQVLSDVTCPDFLTEPKAWHLVMLFKMVPVLCPLLPLDANHQMTFYWAHTKPGTMPAAFTYYLTWTSKLDKVGTIPLILAAREVRSRAVMQLMEARALKLSIWYQSFYS